MWECVRLGSRTGPWRLPPPVLSLSAFTSDAHLVPTPRYFDADTVGLDFKGMVEDLTNAPEGSVVVLHGAWGWGCMGPGGGLEWEGWWRCMVGPGWCGSGLPGQRGELGSDGARRGGHGMGEVRSA